MMQLPFAKDKHYFVLGLGTSGLPTSQALQASGAHVQVWDDNPASRQQAQALGLTVTDAPDWPHLDALVLSPGIPHTYPAPHAFAAAARAAHVPIIGDIELLVQANTQAKIIGITGTNGKSTTTALIGHMLQQAGLEVAVGGNLGTAALTLPTLSANGYYVLELSSYQLELCPSLRCAVAVLLNITPDHLNRHGGMAGYIKAKANILNMPPTGLAVLGIDEPETQAASKAYNGPRTLISCQQLLAQGISWQKNCLYYNGEIFLNMENCAALPGAHNGQNAAAAVAVAQHIGIADAKIIAGLESFPGLAHRQQLVAKHQGVNYINDSKATNADAAGKALACYDNIFWLLGGQAKEGGLAGLEAFLPRIKAAFVYGAAEADFLNWLRAHHVTCSGHGDLSHAFAAAAKAAAQAAPSIVLLSPACASWDQYKSFEARGAHFIALVKEFAQ